MGVVRLLLGKMAVHVNRDPKVPKVEVIRRNFFFIQQSIAASRPVLLTVTRYLLQFELITSQNHDDALARGRLGFVHQAATLARTVGGWLLKPGTGRNPRGTFRVLLKPGTAGRNSELDLRA